MAASVAAQQLAAFDAIIDARSPAEFAEDHLPGAVNWPTLDNDERAKIGTEYKQISAFDARKHGAALIARRIADHLDAHVHDKPKGWKPLVYCWRGGKRSGTLAWFLSEVGFRTATIDGGYKAFRLVVRDQLDTLPEHLNFTVIAGRTGSGKTRLLHALAQHGAQVLDLEGLAKHRGSLLGGLPDEPQPSQKRFEMLVWEALRNFDPKRPVFVESESRKIGARQVPDALLNRMRTQGQCVVIHMRDQDRVQLLLEEYDFYTRDAESFCKHLEPLVEHRGAAKVAMWQAQARAGQWAEVFLDLMHAHYDPLYLRSMGRNYATVNARELPIEATGAAALDRAATALLG